MDCRLAAGHHRVVHLVVLLVNILVPAIHLAPLARLACLLPQHTQRLVRNAQLDTPVRQMPRELPYALPVISLPQAPSRARFAQLDTTVRQADFPR